MANMGQCNQIDLNDVVKWPPSQKNITLVYVDMTVSICELFTMFVLFYGVNCCWWQDWRN